MGLPVMDHLQAMLDYAQTVISLTQNAGMIRGDSSRCCKRIKSRARPTNPEGGITPPMDELVGLGEKFDFADAPTPALYIKTGSRNRGPVMAVTNTLSESADFFDRAEIKH